VIVGTGATAGTVRRDLDNALVAATTIGDGTCIASGSPIIEDVPPGVPAAPGALDLEEEGRGGHRND
jgi:bifunctional N-acetylglucosamine-1-phosphate-uridyltransferase/glucosamine-1-phosphate-acetyltransferase GlmU-like protein